VADAIQQLETARAQAEQAEADWAMLERAAPSALALRKPQLAGAEARLLSAEAELERAQLMLRRTEIVAPFTGMLTDKRVDFGQYLSAGTQIGQLASSAVLEVRLALPERALANLELDALASGEAAIGVTLDSLSGTRGSRWQGRLVRSEGRIDPQTRNLTLVAQFAGDELLASDGTVLTIGQFVRASITGRRYPEVYRLPRTALHKATSVFVIDHEQRLRERSVEVLEINEDHIIVADGLREGEVISVSPLTSSVEGQQVQVVQAQTRPQLPVDPAAPVEIAAEGVTR
jgi:RND family efflux transporter MFP subunit